MIERALQKKIGQMLGGRKAIIIMGARQVGKSTLLKMMLGDRTDVLWLNGDDVDVQELLSDISSTRFRSIIGNNRIVVIAEAQRIQNIGLKIKLVTDQIPEVQVVATGSSSFELAQKVNEPLTGRKREFKMCPVSFSEMVAHTNLLEELRMIPHRMVFGYYPEVLKSPGEERVVLKELSDSYLYRDILSFDNILKSDKLVKLLQALAYQIGSLVSYNELAQTVGIDSKTVEKYIDILEKSYIVFRLKSYAKNMRNELKKSMKIYFWDLGVRNAVIGNFSHIESRTDIGELWENFVISERIKRNLLLGDLAQSWFWRTQQQKEIDYLEIVDGKLTAFEFKWNARKSGVKCPTQFVNSYPDAVFEVITPKNVESFLLE
ncbi:MAG: ATP-binding protein [Muribaculaceae bacterium]|nr:ATP-binding protein [Muribaculaceae bacterium]